MGIRAWRLGVLGNSSVLDFKDFSIEIKDFSSRMTWKISTFSLVHKFRICKRLFCIEDLSEFCFNLSKKIRKINVDESWSKGLLWTWERVVTRDLIILVLFLHDENKDPTKSTIQANAYNNFDLKLKSLKKWNIAHSKVFSTKIQAITAQ